MDLSRTQVELVSKAYKKIIHNIEMKKYIKNVKKIKYHFIVH